MAWSGKKTRRVILRTMMDVQPYFEIEDVRLTRLENAGTFLRAIQGTSPCFCSHWQETDASQIRPGPVICYV